jgi:anaerobic magnesium-protoporphyrin IX monomethyl ester cyclase
MKTRVLFINPETPDWLDNKEYYVPLNYLYLSGTITCAGYPNSLLDLNVVKYRNGQDIDTEILTRLESERPTIVGIGCLFSGQLDAVLHYSTLIKTSFPQVKVVIGGIHPTLYYRDILTYCPSIDYVVVGEGEAVLLRLLDFLEGRTDSIEGVVRLAYRSAVGDVQCQLGTEYFTALDELPPPNYNIVNVTDYYHDTTAWHNPRKLPINASFPVLTSRACPLRCNFCSMFSVMGRKWRYRSFVNVVDEIEWLYNTYNQRHFSIFDDNLTVNRTHIIALCNEIVRRGLRIQFEIPNGVSLRFMDADILDALVTAGLVRLSIAIESGSAYIRNVVMGKRVTDRQIYDIIALTKKYERELYVRAFFLIGMPEDTAETLQETLTMIAEIGVDKPVVSNLIPFPGTRVFDQAVRDKLLVDDLDMASVWRYGKFFFTGQKRFFLKPYAMTIESLSEWRSRFDELIEFEIARKSEWRRSLND